MTRFRTFVFCLVIALVGALIVFGLITDRIRRVIDRAINGRDL